jgi:CubicO group peptidase (beta-lactamase class C family)
MSFDSITHEMIKAHSFTSSHIRIEKWGELLYNNFFSSETFIPFPLFDIASLTKIFTTTAILHLISQGAIDEKTTIKSFFPTYPSSLHHITIDSLLTHTSGLLGWYPFYTQRDTPFEEILRQVLEKNPLENKMIYSDINFMICGKIIEHVLSLPLDEAMQNIVFSPLSLHQTTYHPDKSSTIPTEYGNRIESEMVKERNLQFNQFRPTNKAIIGECNDGNAYYYFKGVAGHAGIFSTTKDINRLISLYVHNSDPTYIHSHLIRKAITDQGNGRGYGFQMGDNYPHGGVGHTGFTGTYLYLNPKKGFTISILTNRLNVAHPGNIQSYRNAIVEEAISFYS